MGILDWLGLDKREAASGRTDGDTETVRKIVAELDAMEPARARHLAAFAYILGRVAHADLDISDDEVRAMEEVVQRIGEVPEDQAILIVQMAKSQNQLFGGTENYLVTREFRDISSSDERQHLLDCLFAVSASDGSISSAEEAQIRLIADELGFTHREYVDTRSRYSDQREVLKPLHDDTSEE